MAVCVTDREAVAHAVIVRRGDWLASEADAAALDEKITGVLSGLKETGAPVRVEQLTPEGIGVERLAVGAENRRFLEGVAEAVRRLGLEAVLRDAGRGRAWFLLQALPFDESTRATVTMALGFMREVDVADLAGALEKAWRRARVLAERRERQEQELADATTAFQKDLESQFKEALGLDRA